MSQRLAGYPSRPQDTQTVTLTDEVDVAGTVYLFTFTWRTRTASWYCDIALQDGTVILAGRRLSPGWPLNLAAFVSMPAGGLLTLGADDFVRDDLGRSNLRVVYYPPSEIAAAAEPADDGISRVTVA